MVTGCLKEGCHYIDGNIKAERRVNAMKPVLLFALIALYFYLGWRRLGGTIWQRALKAR